jgi:hypothetical protein
MGGATYQMRNMARKPQNGAGSELTPKSDVQAFSCPFRGQLESGQFERSSGIRTQTQQLSLSEGSISLATGWHNEIPIRCYFSHGQPTATGYAEYCVICRLSPIAPKETQSHSLHSVVPFSSCCAAPEARKTVRVQGTLARFSSVDFGKLLMRHSPKRDTT